MKKRQILILALAGGMSFISVFAIGWFLKKPAADATDNTSAQNGAKTAAGTTQSGEFDFPASARQHTSMGMTERQLQNLMQDIRNKSRDFKDRQKALDTKAERIEMTSQSLNEDIERLNELRDKLSRIMADIEQKQAQLRQSIIEIQGIEQENFKRLAATYEKMDTTQASRIMVNMAASNQLQDSVKILYYMNERMAGKLLAEIAAFKPELASLICMQLKHVKEST